MTATPGLGHAELAPSMGFEFRRASVGRSDCVPEFCGLTEILRPEFDRPSVGCASGGAVPGVADQPTGRLSYKGFTACRISTSATSAAMTSSVDSTSPNVVST